MSMTDLSLCAVLVKAQDHPPPDELVACYNRVQSCAGNHVAATFSDCCNHLVEPEGFSYQRDGVELCLSCPVSKLLL